MGRRVRYHETFGLDFALSMAFNIRSVGAGTEKMGNFASPMG